MRRVWVLVLFAVGRLAAQQGCGVQPSPTSFDGTNGNSTIPAGGGTFTVNVDSSCSWDVSVPGAPSWITLLSTTGKGAGTFQFRVDPNPNNIPRAATINIPANGPGNWHIPLIQDAANCTLALATTSANATVGGMTSGTVGVQTTCAWNAYSNSSWISVPSGGTGTGSGTSGTGNGPVTYTVAANGCVAARTGTITVGAGSVNRSSSNYPFGTFTITQDGSDSNLTLSPQTRSWDATGGTDRVTVTTGMGCSWSYYTDSSWIQVLGGATGSGSGPSGVTYTIPQNNGPARTGHIYVGSQVYTISQTGAVAPVPQLTAVVNAASYANGSIAPGEVIALGGTGMGPTPGVSAQLAATDKVFPNNLSGVQVMFDGKYAAIPYYVSARQINAIVPFEIAGQTSTQITVSYGGGTSAPLTAQVQPAAPGILTLQFTGTGPGAILNQDYSVNGSVEGAQRGSTVMIYCIGMGQTNPPSADGSITPSPNKLAIQPVTVTIDGIPAQVSYAGGAPGAVAGLTQINATVPANAHTGANIPVTIQVGSYQAQAGVTMAVVQ
jgi:uncharacterized protein (TIGR03437 family)